MLNDIKKICKKRKRIGRGGDRGGTSGKGHKGQKARSGGGVSSIFEGGQTPLSRRLPKRGFSNKRFSNKPVIVSFDCLNKISNRYSVSEITKDLFIQAGVIKSEKEMVKLLDKGKEIKSLTVFVDKCSSGARVKLEEAGGKVCLSCEKKNKV